MSGILQYNLNTSKIPPLSKNDRYFAVKIDPKFYLKIIIIPAILNSHLEFEIPFELVSNGEPIFIETFGVYIV